MQRLLTLAPVTALWAFIFKPAARYPADPRAVFILALSVFSGLTTLALNAGPETLESLLPNWAVLVWGALLSLGSLTTLVGMYFQTPTGIVTEQIGSVAVGATTIFYSLLAIWVIGLGAVQPLAIILAWGISCFVRWAQLQALINQSIREGEHQALQRRVEDAIRRPGEQS